MDIPLILSKIFRLFIYSVGNEFFLSLNSLTNLVDLSFSFTKLVKLSMPDEWNLPNLKVRLHLPEKTFASILKAFKSCKSLSRKSCKRLAKDFQKTFKRLAKSLPNLGLQDFASLWKLLKAFYKSFKSLLQVFSNVARFSDSCKSLVKCFCKPFKSLLQALQGFQTLWAQNLKQKLEMLSQSASKPKFEKLLISRNQPEIRLARLVKAFWKPFASLLKDFYKKPCRTFARLSSF